MLVHEGGQSNSYFLSPSTHYYESLTLKMSSNLVPYQLLLDKENLGCSRVCGFSIVEVYTNHMSPYANDSMPPPPSNLHLPKQISAYIIHVSKN